jgi:two-component system NarL family sensor kinase
MRLPPVPEEVAMSAQPRPWRGVGDELDAAVRNYATRAVRTQMWLRLLLVAFVAATVLAVPPGDGAAACDVIIAGYLAWAVVFALLVRRGGAGLLRWDWLALFVDLAVLTTLTVLTGVAAQQSWTADILVNGMFLIPVLAASQLRPRVCVVVVVPTVLAYLVASLVTQDANDEPGGSILLRTLVLVGVGIGAVALSTIQRERVRTIAGLLTDRSGLLSELVGIEDRERRALSENLHDGALQYVLAARQDLDDLVPAQVEARGSYARVEQALTESSRLLRATVSQLHPAVLEQAGLRRALADLVEGTSARGPVAELDAEQWPDGLRTSVDALVYAAARELLGNVVKHADARTVWGTLRADTATVELVVADDGCGVQAGALEERVAAGHIGLRSHQLRVRAAGGDLRLDTSQPVGTRATLQLPYALLPTPRSR